MKAKQEKHTFDTPTPREIVEKLDKYIIGQDEAKKMVAIALRNRARRKLLPENLRDEVAPKNIIMIGPTGVGKTEVARRLANLAGAPFIKIEASKFTEVGYVGRDVESMIRDLVSLAVNNLKKEMMKEVKSRAEKAVEERLIDLLFPLKEAGRRTEDRKKGQNDVPAGMPSGGLENVTVSLNRDLGNADQVQEDRKEQADQAERYRKTREKIRQKLREGKFESTYVEIEAKETVMPLVEVFTNAGFDPSDMNMSNVLGGMFPKRSKKRKMTVEEARKFLIDQESEKLIDTDKAVTEAVNRTENMGIVFIDEIDKIVGKSGGSGPDISRQGVQRDLLPLVEGCSVMTKYGVVNTNHILFIAAGAFHTAKPSDLVPELQGRFPIRVELKNLNVEDFKNILTGPENALTKQYTALLETEGVDLVFDPSGISRIAEISYQVNTETENIGARRLHTVMEKILEEISFQAPEISGQNVVINTEYVDERLGDIVKDTDLSRYIL